MMLASYNLAYSSYDKRGAGNGDTWINEHGINGCISEMNQGYNETIHSEMILNAGRQIWMSILRLYNIFPEGGGGESVTIDSDISPVSTNPVRNSAIYSALSTKQNTLVSGTNIKTINGVSIVGSGDIVVSGSGTIAIDASLDLSSTNPVQNAVIAAALSGLETTSNKVTSLNSNATDAQYPSAKCVYDLIGDIETLINAL